ncbi:hypothetical protein LTR94_037620, partial [Friedmanniomyces endolithicus]
ADLRDRGRQGSGARGRGCADGGYQRVVRTRRGVPRPILRAAGDRASGPRADRAPARPGADDPGGCAQRLLRARDGARGTVPGQRRP